MENALAKIFSRLFAAVHDYHGSIIHFSGSLLICWFERDNGQRAISAAWRMHNQFEDLKQELPASSQKKPESVFLKSAVAAGSVRRIVLGDPSIQLHDTLAGSLLGDLKSAVSQAKAGECLVAAGILAGLGKGLSVGETRQTSNSRRFRILQSPHDTENLSPWPDTPGQLKHADLRPWLHPALYVQLLTGQNQIIPVNRLMVTLDIGFTGIDVDRDPTAPRQLDQYIRLVQNCLNRYGGFLLQAEILNACGFLTAAFGPPFMHNDDMLRAVEAALTMQSSLPRVNNIVEDGFALDINYFRAGSFGNSARATFGLLSDKPSLGRELLSSARSGQILAGENLVSLLENRIDSRQLPRNGYPVPAYEIRSILSEGELPATEKSAPVIV